MGVSVIVVLVCVRYVCQYAVTSGPLGVSTFPGTEINVGDKGGRLNAQNCKCSERSYTNVYVQCMSSLT